MCKEISFVTRLDEQKTSYALAAVFAMAGAQMFSGVLPISGRGRDAFAGESESIEACSYGMEPRRYKEPLWLEGRVWWRIVNPTSMSCHMDRRKFALGSSGQD